MLVIQIFEEWSKVGHTLLSILNWLRSRDSVALLSPWVNAPIKQQYSVIWMEKQLRSLSKVLERETANIKLKDYQFSGYYVLIYLPRLILRNNTMGSYWIEQKYNSSLSFYKSSTNQKQTPKAGRLHAIACPDNALTKHSSLLATVAANLRSPASSEIRNMYSGALTWLDRWVLPNCCMALSALHGNSNVMCNLRLWLTTRRSACKEIPKV